VLNYSASNVPIIGRLRYLEALPPAVTGSHASKGTLVLIHAFPLNARMWDAQLALAQEGWRVIAPQLRGFDGAEHDPETNGIDDYAGDVIDLLDALHVKEAVIGGLSMGGYVAFAMFRHAPSYFRGIILADTRPQADTPEGLQGRARMLETLESRGVSAVADEMLPKLLGETTRREKPEVVERIRSLIFSSSARAIAGAIRALRSRLDSTPLLSSMHCPALIVVGEEDTITPPEISQEMHRAIPGSALVRIPACGHLPNVERTEAFNAALGEFLRHRV
jgi:pimeloyl-ACP methyl ester carboxylesterase